MSALLEVAGLTVQFRTGHGIVQALSDISLSLNQGDLLLVVGESGSGKTVLAYALLRLLPMNATLSGSVRLNGQELLCASDMQMRRVRGQAIALIPQSPGAALNPVRRLGPLLMEFAQARGLDKTEAHARLKQVLAELDLDFENIAALYPHQLSGGMQQRVVNALALVGAPELVIADEPTSGLDADLIETTATQLNRIRAQGSALLVITHNLRLAERMGGRLALMYASYLVELRATAAFFDNPAHPYGRGLLQALPERGGIPIPGLPPELTALPTCCTFAARCAVRMAHCAETQPSLYALPDGSGAARCLLYAPR